MKTILVLSAISISLVSSDLLAQSKPADRAAAQQTFFIDVHRLEPGKVKFEDVSGAHEKDLAVQKKHGVEFLKYWVDEEKGLVYCLSSAADSTSIRETHQEAHGLLPDNIYAVTPGTEMPGAGGKTLFLDVHEMGPGKVTTKDVEAAHQKDLAVEGKHGVHFINYWVNEKDGVIMCLSEAANPDSVIKTHKEAHGLVPVSVFQVKQGQ